MTKYHFHFVLKLNKIQMWLTAVTYWRPMQYHNPQEAAAAEQYHHGYFYYY